MENTVNPMAWRRVNLATSISLNAQNTVTNIIQSCAVTKRMDEMIRHVTGYRNLDVFKKCVNEIEWTQCVRNQWSGLVDVRTAVHPSKYSRHDFKEHVEIMRRGNGSSSNGIGCPNQIASDTVKTTEIHGSSRMILQTCEIIFDKKLW